MISGVRASSMRIESTSSTMAKASFAARGPRRIDHVVAQVVEAELVVGAVGDVGGVGGLRSRSCGICDRMTPTVMPRKR
jgi:hypothetical protein